MRRRRRRQETLPRASVKHGLDVLPGVNDVVGRGAAYLEMTTPRVEVGCVWLDVFGGWSRAMRVEDELVGREEEAAELALDALGARRVVTGGEEGASTTPSALVVHGEGEVLGEARGGVIAEKGLAQAVCFAAGDHP